jgi:hypothetical protein
MSSPEVFKRVKKHMTWWFWMQIIHGGDGWGWSCCSGGEMSTSGSDTDKIQGQKECKYSRRRVHI